ncbi:lipoprotein [Dyella sp. S184]|jgi:predicted small lipoprotein YifL|uniref:LPS translocon maturation chaperone LptM n=1 Tax=Dyella sp. S184 TaxID=1641862 RepID=UPI00131CE386|nr:lipoprotein [Dyella sp. S184]
MRRSIFLLPLCLVVAMLVGCGQKGPLFLPPVKPAAVSTKPKPPAKPKPPTPAAAASSATPASAQS